MKRCPECRRDYYDDTLKFCLDDGTQLLDGPRLSENATELFTGSLTDRDTGGGDAVTEILPAKAAAAGLSRKKRLIYAGAAMILLLVGFFAYSYVSKSYQKAQSTAPVVPATAATLYWEMSEAEQLVFIAERSQHVQGLIGDEKTILDEDVLRVIKTEIDYYLKRKDSLSQKQFEEGLRAVYGRATQYAPLITQEYEKNNVPPALGLYQAMIESEYHDCPPPPFPHKGPVGMFQFSPSTAAQYGLTPQDYCKVDKQANAAARHMSDLASDFGEGENNASLGLLSYMYGGGTVREFLRQLRRQGVTERSFWAIFRNRQNLQPPLDYVPPDSLPQPISLQPDSLIYVPRFFAAAIIGETPTIFDLSTPPLTTLRK